MIRVIRKTKRSIKWVIGIAKKNKSKHTGIQLVAEFWNGKDIEDVKEFKKILVKAAKKANSTPLKVSIHKFSPQGITGVVLLAESHIAIHSWPEHNYVAIDIFACGEETDPDKALDYLKEKFQPQRVKSKKIKRGMV